MNDRLKAKNKSFFKLKLLKCSVYNNIIAKCIHILIWIDSEWLRSCGNIFSVVWNKQKRMDFMAFVLVYDCIFILRYTVDFR